MRIGFGGHEEGAGFGTLCFTRATRVSDPREIMALRPVERLNAGEM